MKTLYWVLIVVVVGGATFFGGMKYVESTAANRAQTFQSLRNLSPADRQARLQQLGLNGQGGFGGGMMGGMGNRMGTAGDVISKDDKSFTVKMRDGSTKIVFFSPTTQTFRSVDASAADIAIGTTVMVNGIPNADGSVTAQNVQIRPATTVVPSPTASVSALSTVIPTPSASIPTSAQ